LESYLPVFIFNLRGKHLLECIVPELKQLVHHPQGHPSITSTYSSLSEKVHVCSLPGILNDNCHQCKISVACFQSKTTES